MKIPFDIKHRDKIESGEYKVVTRGGSPVRIVCWDYRSSGHFPIIGIVDDGNVETNYSYQENGRMLKNHECTCDLFIVTPEGGLTEFEKCVIDTMVHLDNGEYNEIGASKFATIHEWAKDFAHKLLDNAREEIERAPVVFTKEELTEFEQGIENLLNLADGEGHARPSVEKTKEVAKELLELAREELFLNDTALKEKNTPKNQRRLAKPKP